MNLYSIDDKGNLIELDKLEFDDHHVYLIDDNEKITLYIWVGLEVPQYKKDLTAAWARKFDKDRGGACKILIMMQKREYGSFLSMMENLKKGLIPGETTERRPELVLSVPDELPTSTSEQRIQEIQEVEEKEAESGVFAWLSQLKKHRKLVSLESETELIQSTEREEPIDDEDIGLKSQIREAAYYLSLKKYSYNDLCWLLAESIQKVRLDMPSLEDIHKKAEEVFNSSSTYDELCWLNAQMDILIEQEFLEKKNKYN